MEHNAGGLGDNISSLKSSLSHGKLAYKNQIIIQPMLKLVQNHMSNHKTNKC